MAENLHEVVGCFMKAIICKEPNKVTVEEVADPKIEHPGDAIIRLTSSGICESDIHMYQGRTVAKPGKVLGHEPVGVIEEVGSAVTSFKKEDRVVVTFNVACGHCMNCVRGFTSACLTVNPEIVGGAFGYAKWEYILPLGQLWEKGLTIGTGQTPVKKTILMLRDMIIAGIARPSFIVSHRISIEDAPAAYREFSQRADGYTKVVIKF